MNWILLSPPPLSPTLTTPQNLERAQAQIRFDVYLFACPQSTGKPNPETSLNKHAFDVQGVRM